jgi:hypothetical protein
VTFALEDVIYSRLSYLLVTDNLMRLDQTIIQSNLMKRLPLSQIMAPMRRIFSSAKKKKKTKK